MNNLQIFKNPEFGQIRTATIDGEPWFVGKDVATALGYANPKNAVPKHVSEEDKLSTQIEYAGQNRNVTIINESGLYSLILGSKLESAKRFKHWVTSEVLPSIRKNGGYIQGQETLSDDELIAKALLVAKKKIEERDKIIERQEERIAEMIPKEIFADAVTTSDSSILVRELAKLIKQNGIDIGERRLWDWLRKNGYILKDSTQPSQKAMNSGLFEIIERTIMRGDQPAMIRSTTKVTGKGQVFFINKLLKVKGA